jgi:gentisate 1,2-dioxygenase
MKGTEVFDPRSHYFVQRRRRFKFLEDWRKRRRAIARGEDVVLERSPARRALFGFLAGGDSKVPMRVIDARIIEMAPGETTSTHRHSYDAVCFVLDGQGQTEIARERYAWSRFDTLHTPARSWHRHRNTGRTPARMLAITDAPLVRAFGMFRMEDIGDEPPAPDETLRLPKASSATAYERQLAEGATSWQERLGARRHTAFADVTLRASPKGSRSALLVDSSLGYRTTGISLAMFEVRPGGAQAKHRHPGEAILYVVDGEGHSVIDGVQYEWKTGDAPIVHQYVWHQHFNGSPDRPATVIRMHMWESVIEMMQAAMDPVPLYEDEPGLEERMREVIGALED